MTIAESIQKFGSHLALMGRKQNTVELYTRINTAFFEIVKKKPEEITRDDLYHFIETRLKNEEKRRDTNKKELGRLTENVKQFNPRTVRLYFVAIKTFLLYLGLKENADQIVYPKTQPWLPKKIIEREQFEQGIDIKKVMENYAEKNTRNQKFFVARDFCLLMLLADTGCRISEARNLKHEDLKLTRTVPVAEFDGKTGRRIDELSPVLVGIYKTFLDHCRNKSPFVFVSTSGAQLSVSSMKRIVKWHTGYSPHKFRHFYAVAVTEKHGVVKAQERLGHANLATTSVYLRLIRRKDDAIEPPSVDFLKKKEE